MSGRGHHLRRREEPTKRSGRGLPFELAAEMDWPTALITPDFRKHYPEPRWVALGLIRGEIHTLVFCFEGNGTRIISLRKPNRKERLAWHANRTRT
jgi:uncharacterized DUF497 family protein